MSDVLNRIAAREGETVEGAWIPTIVTLTLEERDALVEVARAARENAEKNSITYRLGDALARLEETHA